MCLSTPFVTKSVEIKKKVFLINPLTVRDVFLRYFFIILPILQIPNFEAIPYPLE